MELVLKRPKASFNLWAPMVVKPSWQNDEILFVFSQTYSTSESAGPAEESEGQVIQV